MAMKCSKCGKSRNILPVEGEAMATDGKKPMTVENVQKAVVKALASKGSDATAFAGMHELERSKRLLARAYSMQSNC